MFNLGLMSQELTKPARSRKILVVEEDKENIDVLLEPLRWEGYDAIGVSNLSEALKTISNWQPHIVLIDMSDQDKNLQVLQKIREKVPLGSCLLFSDDAATDSIINGLDAGADDYIVKPFVPLELLARLRTQLRIRDLQEELVYANEKLKELVDTDDLTGLYNMRSLYEKLDFEMQRARRFTRQVAVVMIDMDNFKSVNDGHDHLFGSYVISEVGKVIKNTTRNIDIPARYGGDEFLIVLTEVSLEGAAYFCEKLRQTIEGKIFKNGGDEISLTISIGFAFSPSQERITARELVRRADHALYESKRQGRNTIFYFDEASAECLHISQIERQTVKKKNSRQSKRKAIG